MDGNRTPSSGASVLPADSPSLALGPGFPAGTTGATSRAICANPATAAISANPATAAISANPATAAISANSSRVRHNGFSTNTALPAASPRVTHRA